jgi:hypothetical protein
MTIKAIITGATGMVGEGVLLDCLNHPEFRDCFNKCCNT